MWRKPEIWEVKSKFNIMLTTANSLILYISDQNNQLLKIFAIMGIYICPMNTYIYLIGIIII